MLKKALFITGLWALAITSTFAKDKTVTIYDTKDNKTILGKVRFHNSPYGLMIYPDLHGLEPGLHGLHLHEHPNCENGGMSAGSHFDPKHTNSHQGPYGKGHLGDLPVLYVMENGKATTPTLAPRLSLDDIHNLAVMIHQGGDNYSNTPPLGGGGKRVGCGVMLDSKQP